LVGASNLGSDEKRVTIKVRQTLELGTEYTPSYSGKYSPVSLEHSPTKGEWVFIRGTVVPASPGKEHFWGWIVRDREYLRPNLVLPTFLIALLAGSGEKPAILFAGLTMASKPSKGRFIWKDFKGRPSETASEVTVRAQSPWFKHFVQFERYFMQPANQPLTPSIIVFTVTFISVEGEDLGEEDSNLDPATQKPITAAMHNMFGKDIGVLFYIGRHEPKELPNSPMERKWIFFKVENPHTGLTYYGYIARGGEYSLLKSGFSCVPHSNAR
jgi:hypothetical protein